MVFSKLKGDQTFRLASRRKNQLTAGYNLYEEK